MPKIKFIVPCFRPSVCGVSDYVVRMIEGLHQIGIDAELRYLASTGTAADVQAERLSAADLNGNVKLAVQWVPRLSKQGCKFCWKLIRARAPIHLMIHECWYLTKPPEHRWIRWKAVQLLQKLQLRLFIALARPTTVGASNQEYQKILQSSKISAEISPMPGTIRDGVGSKTDLDEVSAQWLGRSTNRFVWAQVGSLSIADWNPDEYFCRIHQNESRTAVEHFWIICGRQKDRDRNLLLESARNHGFEVRIHFTGPVSDRTIDAVVHRCNAAFASAPYELRAKSSGALIAIERGVPLYFPRNDGQQLVEPGEECYTSIDAIVKRGLVRHQNPRPYNGPHRSQNAAKAFASHFLS